MIESALYAHLMSKEMELGSFLAYYDNKMAIFNQEVPDDKDPRWDKDSSQYGRIVFSVDMRGNPERKISGLLYIDVMCVKGGESPPPELLEPIIKSLVDNYFFPTTQGTMAVQWQSSNYFSEPEKKVCGVTLVFSLMAFPIQTALDPDPIDLLNKWTEESFPNAHVVNHSEQPGAAWQPTEENPAIYWRTTQITNCVWIPDTYTASWLTATIRGHIISPDFSVNNAICRDVEQRLVVAKRIIFDDDSPLMIDRRPAAIAGADPLKDGQISFEATFGVLNHKIPGARVGKVSFAHSDL